MSEFKATGTKMKCTYHFCEGDNGGGIVDENLRPWHMHCALKVLVGYGSLINTLGPFALGILIGGALVAGFLLERQ